MKQAPNQPCAAPGVSTAGRLARMVRGGAAACVLALLAAGAAHAQRNGGDHGQERRDEARVQQDARAPEQGREQRFDPRSFDSREFDQRRQQQLQQEQNMRNAEARRSGRMTPDERRDLRRQINEAGQDLYPNTQRR